LPPDELRKVAPVLVVADQTLHALIERGPDWNTIDTIVVRLNPNRTNYPDDTVEAAEQR
jgi:hypothetical protein